ncbi:GTPase HflX (plasmid) [Halorussus salilacus]|uniref:GTPase HflX n=1 Tax=Halorussus salilacus TaxID=2953750 RepID=UPI0020A0C315|nr:GTPase HflX [Halorussus salilacus]USZ69795.1 GTPase HflX [Halorussus salilacus]
MQARRAVVAKRTDSRAVDTDEVRRLAEAAGYEVVAELTQTRAEDSTTQFGRGKVEELVETVAETDASVVVFDNELTPTQTVELAEACPGETTVLDRYRLVLDIFESGAGTKRAELQVRREQLQWELPRIRECSDEQAMNRFTESGTRYYDVRDRIDELDRKLADLGERAHQRRERRREEGFEFVALAGYTNAGKSTLLHRLADDLDFEAREADHADLDATAEVEDRLFKTLDTTTRRATVRGRRALVTDTVGFVDDLPHDLVSSFHDTLSATESAECVVLVADASDPPAELRRKLRTGFDLLEDAEGEVVVALNKADLVPEGDLAARREVAADFAAEPLAVSATAGTNLDALRDRIAAALPDRREATLSVPNDDDAMSLVSWLYDRVRVEDVTYADDEVRVEFAGTPSIVERARGRADRLVSES